MSQSKFIFIRFLFLACVVSMTGCQQEDKKDGDRDKDEQQSLVVAQELSNSRVQCIEEDATGQLWIATFRGLNRYDGYEYHQYFCTDDSLGLPDNNVQSLLCDKRGRLWVATVNGVCRYTKKDCFERIPMQTGNRNARKLLMDSRGRVFVYNGTEVLMYDELHNIFLPRINRQMIGQAWGDFFIDAADDILLSAPGSLLIFGRDDFKLRTEVKHAEGTGYYFFALLENGLLLSSGDGTLMLFDTKARQQVPLSPEMATRITAHGSVVQAACLLQNNTILLSTSKNGLFELNLLSHTLYGEGDADFTLPVPDAYVTQIFQDSRHNIWLGTYDKGLFADYYYKEKFGGSDNYLNRVIDNSSVLAVAVDQEENLWVATLLKGVFVYHTATQKAEQVEIAGLPVGESKNAVNHIFCDRDGGLWLSTSNNVMKCRYDGQRLSILGQWFVPMAMDFEQTDDGTVWVATSTTYIFGFHPGSSEPEAKQAFNVDYTFIPSLQKLDDGQLLIAAFYQNIMRLDPTTGKLNQLDIPDMQRCIRRSVFIPTDMHQDRHGNVWIGTVSNGLLRYNPKTNQMTRIAGLSCSDVASIEEGHQGNLWISTMKGLNRLDIKTGRITSLYKADGLASDEFTDRASCQLSNGCLVFGGTDGITMFNPADIDTLRRIPLRFSHLKIHNQLVRPAKGGPIEAMLDSCRQIRLAHDQNSFSISFTALDFGEYERVHYYYKLDGFDDEWIDAGSNHSASYANLPSGHYTFHVRTTDSASDQNNSDERSISIVVEPSPAFSWWAWLIYLVLGSLLAFYLYQNARRLVKARRATRQAQLEKEQEQRVNAMNMSFFANISHEFRTPLTTIKGPVDMLTKSDTISDTDRDLLVVVQRSVRRMLRLVNQLMDFNKLENDTLKLSVSQQDAIPVIRQICDAFQFNMKEKNITFRLIGLEDSMPMWVDSDKLEKILVNLLSNAIKYTPSGGQVTLTVDTDDSHLSPLTSDLSPLTSHLFKLTVADTGRGIPEDQLENIFKRYYQLDNQTKGTINWGTGIGLYYSRRLAELHHGTLTAANIPSPSGETAGGRTSGSIFTLLLPMGEEAYSDAERQPLTDDTAFAYPAITTQTTPTKPPQGEASDHSPLGETEGGRSTILVVDDDSEVVGYLRALLSPHYRVVCRYNADDALKAIAEEEPAIVLSDVVMPGKDGYALCREIKDDLQMCHIPVILVTAKSTAENQIEGLNTGADAYVTKPFDPHVLLAQIKSLLGNRQRIQHILTTTTTTGEQQVEDALSPQDKAFMDELYRLMEDELANSELDVTRITEMLYISRTKLYYKIKGLTGETPSSFFRLYKLNRAAQLIKEGKHTISEVADLTGFSTLSHFSSLFKKQFGVSPSEYR